MADYRVLKYARAQANKKRFIEQANDFRAAAANAADAVVKEADARFEANPFSFARRRGRFRGRGAYSFSKFRRDAAGFGKMLGPNIMGALEGRAVSAIGGRGLYTGQGAYTHTNNLVNMGYGQGSTGGVPSFQSVGDETGGVIVSHSEYIGDVYGPGTASSGVVTPFSIQSWALNPGLQSTFPFLSQIACNYDEYEFIQLLFHYRSTTTDIGSSTTGQCGTIIMACNYNASASSYTDKQQMLEAAHAHDCKVTENMTHGIECDPEKTALASTLYVRSNPTVAGEDLKTYDKGTFQVAVCNCPPGFNGLPIGELWVEYSVGLRKPKLFVTRGLDIDRDLFQVSNSLVPSQTPALWMGAAGTTYLKAQQNNIGIQVLKNMTLNNNPGITNGTYPVVLLFPANYAGNVRIDISLTGTGLTGGLTTAISAVNMGLITDNYRYGGGPLYPSNVFVWGTGSSYELFMDVWVRPSTNGYNNYIAFSAIGGTTITSAVIDVCAYQPLASNSQNVTASGFAPQFVNVANGQLTIPSYT